MTQAQQSPRPILVISSFVVRGSVGARAAFALERLGHQLWSLPTILLPWHPGHTPKQGPGTRIVTPPQELESLLKDLARSSWLPELGGILTGYLGDAAQAGPIADFIRTARAANPQMLYLCDPVMGDGAKLYVPQATAAAIRDELVPLADIVTPNMFELGWLTGGAPQGDLQDMIALARQLGPKLVAVTSAPALMRNALATLLVDGENAFAAEHNLIESAPNGTGDLFAALLLSRRLAGAEGEALLQQAVAGTFEMVARSVRLGSDELALAQLQDGLLRPMAMVSTRRIATPSARQPTAGLKS